MRFDLEDKLFVLAVLFGVAWLVSMFMEINPVYIDSIKNVVVLIVGAFLVAYKKKEGGKNDT